MIRILIADDHSIVRRGLKQILLEEFPDAIIGEAADGIELPRMAMAESWNIIISDLAMPGRNGLEVLKLLKEKLPKVPVLILSMHPEDQYAIRVFKAGASGYLTKESASDELVHAVRKILDGRRYISPDAAEKLAQNLEQDSSRELHEILSDREFDVLKMIATGKTVSEIAELLTLSVTTVSTYRARVLFKTNMKNNAELTHYAIEHKLV
jgi:two-component system invasion response regulator UvrY